MLNRSDVFVEYTKPEAAKANVTRNQWMTMVNGHVTLQFNDTNRHVSKTTFWGYNWECGKNLETMAGGGPGTGGNSAAPAQTAPAQSQPARKAPGFGVPGVPNPLGRFGF